MLLVEQSKLQKFIRRVEPYYFSIGKYSMLLFFVLYCIEITKPFSISYLISMHLLLMIAIIVTLPLLLISRQNLPQYRQELKSDSKKYFFPIITEFFAIFLLIYLIGGGDTKFKLFSALLSSLAAVMLFLTMRMKTVVSGFSDTFSLEGYPINRRFSRVSLLFFVILLVLFFYLSFVPSGILVVTIPITSSKNRLVNFTSSEKGLFYHSTLGKKDYLLVSQNPFTFSVNVPRAFASVKAKLIYQPTTRDGNVLFGAKSPAGGYLYSKLATYNNFFENMPVSWGMIREGDYVLFQRDRESELKLEQGKRILDERTIFLENEYLREKSTIESRFLLGEISEFEKNKKVEEALSKKEKEKNSLSESINDEIISSRKVKYSSIEEFYSDEVKNFRSILVSGTSMDNWYKPGSLVDNSENFFTDRKIRGSFTLLVYLSQESDLRAFLKYKDLNRHEGGDEYQVRLTRFDHTLQTEQLYDDGNISHDNIASGIQELKFTADNIGEGLYRLEIITNDDVITSEISVLSPYVVFEKKLYSADGPLYKTDQNDNSNSSLVLYTNGTEIGFVTAHEESLQTIQVNSQNLELNVTHEVINIDSLAGITKIYLPKGDVKIITDGVISFSPTSPLFNYWHHSQELLSTENALEKIETILAYYPRPILSEDGWFEATGTLYAPGIAFVNNKADFQINFGSLGVDTRTVKIKEITLTFQKDPITLKNVFSKLKEKINTFTK